MEFSKEKIRWIVIISAILVILGLTIAAVVVSNKQAKQMTGTLTELSLEDNSESLAAEPISITPVIESGIMIVEKPMFLGAGDGGSDSAFAKTLTATVLPIDAPDKTVDWSVAWASDASRSSQQVSQYITVTPNSDGSNVAVVRCLKGFEGDHILVTVTTRVGGFSATCQVDYVGTPQTLTINTSGKTVKTDTAWNKSMVELQCGSDYTFNLDLDNDLHAVGSSYGNYTFSVATFGTIQVNLHAHNNYSGEDTYSVETEEYKIADLLESDGYIYTFFEEPGGLCNVLRVEIENGKLVVKAQRAISSLAGISGNRGGYAERTFKEYTDGKCPYVTITVTETTTGLSKSINVKTIATVTNVNMSASTMSF